MQRDVHFYATLAIAKAAGYPDDESILLAWANEECDYTLQVKAWNCLWSNLGLYYHFIPGDPKTLICRPNSELCGLIIESAQEGEPFSRTLYLCRIGITLHSAVQDPHSHSGWVGKFSRRNVLPAWSQNKFTPSLPFPYGHSPKGKEPDIATISWYDPRTDTHLSNWKRVSDALLATAKVLGITDGCPSRVTEVMVQYKNYEQRKQKLRDIAGMPNLHFSDIRKGMLRKYGKEFKAAAKAQAAIVKENI